MVAANAVSVREAANELGEYVRPGFAAKWRELERRIGTYRAARAAGLAVAVGGGPSMSAAASPARPRVYGAKRRGQHEEQWRATRRHADPLFPPDAGYPSVGVRDKACIGASYIDRDGRRRAVRAHRCSDACTWSMAQALAWLAETPLPGKVGPSVLVPNMASAPPQTVRLT